MFPIDGALSPIIAVMAGSLILVLALIAIVGCQWLSWSLVNGYARRREEQFAPAVLQVLIEPRSLRSLAHTSRFQRTRLGPRPFDQLILERMLLRQAAELRGSDRALMAEIFDETGLAEQAKRQLRSRRWWRRIDAAQRLRVMRCTGTVPALMWAAADRNPNVRVAVLRALAEINDERAYPLLLCALENQATSLRMADMLLMVGPAISPYLLERCHTLNNPPTQALYVRLLGLLQEPRALEVLLPLAHAADLHLRLEAIVALGAIGDASAVTVLHTALDDPDRQIRAEAACALGRIGDQASAPALRARLADPIRIVRYGAARALIQLGPVGERVLRQAAQDGEPAPRGIAEQVLAERALALR
jgi:HEAT repeat protein